MVDKAGNLVATSLTVVPLNGPYVGTAVSAGGDFAGAVRITGGAPWRDLTHPTYGLAAGATAAVNTTAITNALADAVLGETLFAPPGTYNHNAITWNKRVNCSGASAQGTVFNYVPTIGTAWTINAANVTNDPRTFGFYRLTKQGGPTGGTAYLNATTGQSIASNYSVFEDVAIQQFGIGTTYVGGGAGAYFVTHERCSWQFCGQLLFWPNAAGERVDYQSCKFINAQTFANGVQNDGNAELYFNQCSIDNAQVSLTRSGATCRFNECHFETVGSFTSAQFSMTAGSLMIQGGTLLVPAGSAMPTAFNCNDSGDVTNTGMLGVFGLRCYSNGVAVPIFTLSGTLAVFLVFEFLGGWSNDLNDTRTGGKSFIYNHKNFTIRTKFTGITGWGGNALDTALVAGLDVSGYGNYATSNITAARLIGAPLNPAQGQRFTFILRQTGAGGFAITWNAVFKGVTWSDVGNVAGRQSSISFEYDGVNWNQVGAQAPYAV
jgi:hypothetical protein